MSERLIVNHYGYKERQRKAYKLTERKQKCYAYRLIEHIIGKNPFEIFKVVPFHCGQIKSRHGIELHTERNSNRKNIEKQITDKRNGDKNICRYRFMGNFPFLCFDCRSGCIYLAIITHLFSFRVLLETFPFYSLVFIL